MNGQTVTLTVDIWMRTNNKWYECKRIGRERVIHEAKLLKMNFAVMCPIYNQPKGNSAIEIKRNNWILLSFILISILRTKYSAVTFLLTIMNSNFRMIHRIHLTNLIFPPFFKNDIWDMNSSKWRLQLKCPKHKKVVLRHHRWFTILNRW